MSRSRPPTEAAENSKMTTSTQTEPILLVATDESLGPGLRERLEKEGFSCQTAPDGRDALTKAGEGPFALAVADLERCRLEAGELVRNLQSIDPDLCVVLLLNPADPPETVAAMESGACRCLFKPISTEQFLLCVHQTLGKRRLVGADRQYQSTLEMEIERRTAEAESSFLNLLKTMALMLEARDPYTEGHSRRVAAGSMALAHQLGLGETELEQLEIAGLLHDIGKIGVREDVLKKPGPLTDEEFDHVKIHSTCGERILRPIKQFQPVLAPVRHHHERYNGSGYPDGLEGEAIPLPARILAVADVFDAMTSHRAYRPARPRDWACQQIVAGRHTLFDPDVVEAFLAIMVRPT